MENRRYTSDFGLWQGHNFTQHSVSTVAPSSKAALRKAVKLAIRQYRPSDRPKAISQSVRGALATVGSHHLTVPESTRRALQRVCKG